MCTSLFSNKFTVQSAGMFKWLIEWVKLVKLNSMCIKYELVCI